MVLDQWCKEVTKRTDGRVSAKLYPGGTLAAPVQIYDSIVKGVIDVGYAIPSYSAGKFPLSEVLELPLGSPNAVVSNGLANDYFKKFRPKEFDEVQVMYFDASNPFYLHTKKPVRTLEDLKGMKIKTSSTSMGFLKLLGGIPVTLPMADTYDATKRGVVDGFFAGWEGMDGFRLAEVVKYTTENSATAYLTLVVVAMNKDKWKQIKAEDQKIIEQINRDVIQRHLEVDKTVEDGGRSFTLKRGNEIIKLSAAENTRWAEKAEPLFDEYVRKMKAKSLPGDEVLKFARDYLKKHAN
jgi:TRAP-type C4-dicarboxylate transport system substrate-binding protein